MIGQELLGLGLWCLMPLSTVFQLYRVVSFIGRGQTLSHNVVSSTPRHEWDSN